MHVLVSAVLFLSLWSCSDAECPDPIRVRRPWHDLSESDQMLFVTGFQELAKGELEVFLKVHEKATANDTYNIHLSSQNFYWHSYWLYELENAFRRLGAEWECFTLPYWDVTHDEAAWSAMEEVSGSKDVRNLPIYRSSLGGEGDPMNDNCVSTKPWTREEYVTDYLCSDDEEAGNCCLKRLHLDNSTLVSMETFTEGIFTDKKYWYYTAFFDLMNTLHGYIHQFVGTVAHTHFHPNGGKPAVDPLFPVFHAFIDYLRLMRHDCYEYDRVAAEDLDRFIPFVYDVAHEWATDLDFAMDFSYLCDDTQSVNRDRMCSQHIITPRLMMDLSPNTEFNVVYELGDFWGENKELKTQCTDYLNDTWWSNKDYNGDAEGLQFVEDRVSRSAGGLYSAAATAAIVLVAGSAIVALLKFGCQCALRREKSSDRHGLHYGAVVIV